MTIELLPCPFCGGKVEAMQTDGLFWHIEHMTGICSARMGGLFQTESEVTIAWNRRTPSVVAGPSSEA